MFTLATFLGGTLFAALKTRYNADQVDEAWSELLKHYAQQKDWPAVKWLRAHEPQVRAAMWAELPGPKGSLFSRFSPRSMPRPGQKGHKPPAPSIERPDLALSASLMLALARDLFEEYEIFDLTLRTRQALGHVNEGDPVLEEASLEDAEALADWLSVPTSLNVLGSTQALPLNARDRGTLALNVMELAAATRHEGLELPSTFSAPGDYTPNYPDLDEPGPLPVWIAEAILADALADPTLDSLRLGSVSRDEADAFIRFHHSVLGKPGVKEGGVPYRTMYLLGARYGDRLVAVASAGHPSGRWANQKNGLELTRIASDSTVPNASSLLASRLLDLAPFSRRGAPDEPWHFVTYSLVSESGATYEALRDKGLRPVAVNPGRAAGGGGRRQAAQAAVEHPKIVWEAGPAARPARWYLVTAARNGAPIQQLLKASRFANDAKARGEERAQDALALWL